MPRNARINDLLRRRDRLRKSRQLWLAGLVIWGVVIGWVAFGLINSITDDLDVLLTWLLVWLLPVVILAGGALVTHLRVTACARDLVEVERQP